MEAGLALLLVEAVELFRESSQILAGAGVGAGGEQGTGAGVDVHDEAVFVDDDATGIHAVDDVPVDLGQLLVIQPHCLLGLLGAPEPGVEPE